MGVRNMSEQVVLDLIVQAPGVPSNGPIAWAEVGSGLHLANHPLVWHQAVLVSVGRREKLGFIHAVGQLERDDDEGAQRPHQDDVDDKHNCCAGPRPIEVER